MNGGEKQIPTSALGITRPPSYGVPVVSAPVPMVHFGANVGLASTPEMARQLENFLRSPVWKGKTL